MRYTMKEPNGKFIKEGGTINKTKQKLKQKFRA